MFEKKIVIASNNSGKLREIRSFLQNSPYEFVPQSDYAVADTEETGLTFVENALLKARHAAQETGLPSLADDSGLVVDVLQGEPGVYSARYAGVGATDKMNIDKLLNQLSGKPKSDRQASFYCVIALLRNPTDPVPIIYQGSWKGEILFSPRGNNGFGYDPIFYVPELNCSAAELNLEVKNRLSHRAKALQKLIASEFW